MALKGTLKDFGIADIFQLIGQQQKTGVLHLLARDQEVHVAFKDGSVVKAESSTRKKKELLGDMLVRAGLVTERQLEVALEEQKRTLKRLGAILVAAKSISRESLREMTQLQTAETIYRLFSWKSGNYEFESAEVDFDPESMTPIRSESVLMEGFRRVDEWPLIRKKITSPSMSFQRLKELPKAKPYGAQDEVDSAFDDAFGEPAAAKEPEESHGEFKNIGQNERLVFALSDPGREVATIVDRSRLGEFEASKALLNLVNLGYLKPLAAAGKSASASEGRSGLLGERLVPLAGRLAVGLMVLAAAALVLSRADVRALGLGQVAERHYADEAHKRVLARAQGARLETALSVYGLRHGRAPDSLQELVEAGILSQDELRYPWDEAYYYRKVDEASYVLLAPMR